METNCPTAQPNNPMGNSHCFSQEHLQKLFGAMQAAKVPAGTYLYWEGDAADKLYYVRSGRVKMTKANSEGKQFMMYMFQEGDFFGQLDPYFDSRQAFNALTVEDCWIGTIAKPELETLLWQQGELAVAFMKWMGLMHRMTQTKFRDMMLYGKPGALCSTLIRMANTFGARQGDDIFISEKLTNTDLAEYIGAARESVNRMLADLRKANVIEYENGYITIKNIDYLRNICHCDNCPTEICRL
ncbi:Crp/Fnr family transcriptional regulator [Paenibacillus sp. MBLB4367]|uniref:Crp/Fnr family transcriptional regulator n=1 Tax=Paenibacillus sp. MBLB4367 TaxID=3384767 RepID=UPI0039082E07